MCAAAMTPATPPIRESLRLAGEKVSTERCIEVRHPYTGALIGTAAKAGADDVKRALRAARGFRSTLSRHDRCQILMRARSIVAARSDDLAQLITLESGICL